MTRLQFIVLVWIALLIYGCQPPEGEPLGPLDKVYLLQPDQNTPTIKPAFRIERRESVVANGIDCQAYVRQYGTQTTPIFDESDIPSLIDSIERVTGRPWMFTFAENWLSCHPFEENFKYMDVNNDGMTDLHDFSLLSRQKGGVP